jgi:hypothetical protein
MRTEGHDEANSRFCSYANAPKNMSTEHAEKRAQTQLKFDSYLMSNYSTCFGLAWTPSGSHIYKKMY